MAMYNKIEIGGKPLELTSNAATPRLYQKVFGRDLLKSFANLSIDEGSTEALDALDLIQGLAFVMNLQSQGKPFREIYTRTTDLDYLDWLEQFEDDDFKDPDKLREIVATWSSSARTSVQAKNQASPRSES